MLVLRNDDGTELFSWTADDIRFDASVKEADRLTLCFTLRSSDPKAMAKTVAKQRAEHRKAS